MDSAIKVFDADGTEFLCFLDSTHLITVTVEFISGSFWPSTDRFELNCVLECNNILYRVNRIDRWERDFSVYFSARHLKYDLMRRLYVASGLTADMKGHARALLMGTGWDFEVPDETERKNSIWTMQNIAECLVLLGEYYDCDLSFVFKNSARVIVFNKKVNV